MRRLAASAFVFAVASGLLADGGVGLEYVYAFNDYREGKEALGVMRVEDNAKAVAVLQAAGITLVDEDQLYN